MADRAGLAGLPDGALRDVLFDVLLDVLLDVLPEGLLPPRPGALAAWLAVCFDVGDRAEGLIGRARVDDVVYY